MSNKKLKTGWIITPAPPVRNVIGWIQRGIKLNLLYGNQHWAEVVLYLQKVGFKIKKEEVMKALQRMVRAKYDGYNHISSMKGFIPNPNPNSKGKK